MHTYSKLGVDDASMGVYLRLSTVSTFDYSILDVSPLGSHYNTITLT